MTASPHSLVFTPGPLLCRCLLLTVPHYSASESFVENIPMVPVPRRPLTTIFAWFVINPHHCLLPLTLSRSELQRSDV